MKVTMPIPKRTPNFQRYESVPVIIDTVSKKVIIDKQLKKSIAPILIADGTTDEPNRPRIVHTKQKIVSPPPIDIEYFVRLKSEEHIKQ